MSSGEKRGCLGQLLLWLFAPTKNGRDEDLPYRLRDDFLSAAERSFYGVLTHAVKQDAVICPKVNLGDLFYVLRATRTRQAHKNRIDRKHVDFLLCDPATMKPRLGVELDDRSHEREDRRERDEFVEEVFAVADLPLLRVPVRRQYSVTEVRHAIDSAWARSPQSPLPRESSTAAEGVPSCPKCQTPMIKRKAKRGPQTGSEFWGCQNYPKCQGIVEIE